MIRFEILNPPQARGKKGCIAGVFSRNNFSEMATATHQLTLLRNVSAIAFNLVSLNRSLLTALLGMTLNSCGCVLDAAMQHRYFKQWG